MHPDLERIVAEDDIGRAAVDAARAAARARVDAARETIARQRAARLGVAERQLDQEIAAADAAAEREFAARRERRETFVREQEARAAGLVDAAADVYMRIAREGT
jgi:hypothetical protein